MEVTTVTTVNHTETILGGESLCRSLICFENCSVALDYLRRGLIYVYYNNICILWRHLLLFHLLLKKQHSNMYNDAPCFLYFPGRRNSTLNYDAYKWQFLFTFSMLYVFIHLPLGFFQPSVSSSTYMHFLFSSIVFFITF